MTDALDKALIYGFNDEISGLLETSTEGAVLDVDKNVQKAEIAEAILDQTKKDD